MFTKVYNVILAKANMSTINLNLYDVGVCYVKDWCSDSKRIASQLKSQPLKILFVDYDTNAIYQYNSTGNKFLNTKVIHKYVEVDENMPSHVPLLYLINKTTKQYDGPWTTHHGQRITFTNRNNSVYKINKNTTIKF